MAGFTEIGTLCPDPGWVFPGTLSEWLAPTKDFFLSLCLLCVFQKTGVASDRQPDLVCGTLQNSVNL